MTQSFDLTTTAGWQALAAEWRAQRALWMEALDAHGRAENAAQSEIEAASNPSNAEREAIRERHGVEAANDVVSERAGPADELLVLALETAAPTRTAFEIKLSMIGHREGIYDFQMPGVNEADYWEVFIADVCRFSGVQLAEIAA